MENLNTQNVEPKESDILNARLQRRSFLQYAGAGAAAIALTAAGCKKDRGIPGTGPIVGGGAVTIDFKNDFGVLNYAYALEQLEAAFYIQVAANVDSISDFNAEQKAYFKDVQYHEIAHREFLKKALAGNAIKDLEVDFSKIDFRSKSSILATAQTFEDLGVAAYNGAGRLLKDPGFLLIAGKIVSVEARHASWVRDQVSPGSFSNLETLGAFGASNTLALDGYLSPDKVVPFAQPYIKTKLIAIGLNSQPQS